MGKLTHYLRMNVNLAGQELRLLENAFKPFSAPRHSILQAEGQLCRELYFVSSGCVRTYYLTGEGQEKTRFVAFENTFITCISGFITGDPSFEVVETLEDSHLYAISREDFFRFVNDFPEWEKFYRMFLERAYVHQNKRIEQRVTLSAGQRYKKLLEETPWYSQRLSNKILASYLDITQETLSRLKSTNRF